MNSMSKDHCKEEKDCCWKKEKEDKKEEGTKVLLKCGSSSSINLDLKIRIINLHLVLLL